MIESNFAYDYINNIPWDDNPTFAFSGDTNAYIKAFESVIDANVLPIGDMKISFEDDYWDFNPYLKDTNTKDNRFSFEEIKDSSVKNYCKFYVLYEIMGRKKISTINVRFTDFKSLYLNIIRNTNHNSLWLITNEDIINNINSRGVSPSTAHNLYEAAYQFYNFFIKNYKLKLPVDLKELKELGIKEKNLAKQNIEVTKIPNIPEEYFIKILNKCLELMRNKDMDYSTRVTAAMIVILSQTGLRTGDLLSLKIDNLFKKRLTKSGNTTHYIQYTAKKPSKAHAPLLQFEIFSNSLATEAFNLLIKLRKKCDGSKKHKFIYVLPSTINSKDEYPLQPNRFYGEYRKLMYKHMKLESSMKWEGITSCKYRGVELNIPEPRQFRVHLCTTLYEKGVPLVYIQRYMSHLSEYMMGYYVRPKDTYQENIQYSSRVIKEIVEEDITPLGGSLIGNDIKKNIQQFITDNDFNIKTDIDEIMKTLGNKVIIRGKTGGVCIKTSLMPCSKDARTNEMMCAYNLCPNLFHFYYMIDVTYLNFKTLQESYNAMKNNGNTKAAQKELNKLKDLVRRRLVPELDELEKELTKKGTDTVIEQHPSVVNIVENMEEIRREVEIWTNKH